MRVVVVVFDMESSENPSAQAKLGEAELNPTSSNSTLYSEGGESRQNKRVRLSSAPICQH
jgi:hypothetical protein